MILLAHQQGHKVSVAGVGVGAGRSILKYFAVWMAALPGIAYVLERSRQLG